MKKLGWEEINAFISAFAAKIHRIFTIFQLSDVFHNSALNLCQPDRKALN